MGNNVLGTPIVKILKPEQLESSAYDSLRQAAADAGKPTGFEVRALVMILALPVLWIAGTWVPLLNVTTVAIIGLAIMMLPGLNLLTWDCLLYTSRRPAAA